MTLAGFVLLDFLNDRGPRAHQAHMAKKNIGELRQFVKAVLAQKAAKGRDSRIVRNFEEDPVALISRGEILLQFLGVLDHGPELETPERPVTLSDSGRQIED